MFIFGLHSTSMISQAVQAKNVNWNVKKQKRPLSHWKIKCSFLDYIQLLMIGRAIQAKNVDQNTKKQKRPPKSSKNKMFIFGLHSTSDDWLRVIWVMNGDWNAKRGLLSHQKWNVHFLMVYQKTSRRLPEDCQKTSRRLPEDHQKASGCLLAVF